MAALMKLPVIFIFSHDSVVVGEDGPTHQPIEHLSHLRAIPGLEVWRPADVNETALAWRQVLHRRDGPSCLILSRQKLPSLCRFDAVFAQGEGLVVMMRLVMMSMVFLLRRDLKLRWRLRPTQRCCGKVFAWLLCQ